MEWVGRWVSVRIQQSFNPKLLFPIFYTKRTPWKNIVHLKGKCRDTSTIQILMLLGFSQVSLSPLCLWTQSMTVEGGFPSLLGGRRNHGVAWHMQEFSSRLWELPILTVGVRADGPLFLCSLVPAPLWASHARTPAIISVSSWSLKSSLMNSSLGEMAARTNT